MAKFKATLMLFRTFRIMLNLYSAYFRLMKNSFLTLFLLLMLSITSYAQVTTFFYGRDKVKSKNETAALYSVAIYEYQTWVTVELIPTKNRSRMNFWTSNNTYIIVGNGMEIGRAHV